MKKDSEKEEISKIKKWLALMLSVAIPGVGQVFNMQLKKSIFIWVLSIISLILEVYGLINNFYGYILAGTVLFTAVYLWNVYDAFKNAG